MAFWDLQGQLGDILHVVCALTIVTTLLLENDRVTGLGGEVA